MKKLHAMVGGGHRDVYCLWAFVPHFGYGDLTTSDEAHAMRLLHADFRLHLALSSIEANIISLALQYTGQKGDRRWQIRLFLDDSCGTSW